MVGVEEGGEEEEKEEFEEGYSGAGVFGFAGHGFYLLEAAARAGGMGFRS